MRGAATRDAMTSRLAPARAATRHEGHAAVLVSCLFALGGCEREPQPRPSVQALATLGGATDCNFRDFDGSVCRNIDNLHLTDALRYPLLLRQQGWREVEEHRQPNDEPMNEDGPLWFERDVDGDCSELISVRLIPGPPNTGQGPALLIRTDYDPVCAGERKTQ